MDELFKALFSQSPSLAILGWFAYQSWRERQQLQATVTSLVEKMVAASIETSHALKDMREAVIKTHNLVQGCHQQPFRMADTVRIDPNG